MQYLLHRPWPCFSKNTSVHCLWLEWQQWKVIQVSPDKNLILQSSTEAKNYSSLLGILLLSREGKELLPSWTVDHFTQLPRVSSCVSEWSQCCSWSTPSPLYQLCEHKTAFYTLLTAQPDKELTRALVKEMEIQGEEGEEESCLFQLQERSKRRCSGWRENIKDDPKLEFPLPPSANLSPPC